MSETHPPDTVTPSSADPVGTELSGPAESVAPGSGDGTFDREELARLLNDPEMSTILNLLNNC